MAQVTVTAQYIADTQQYVANVKKATDATKQFAGAIPSAEGANKRLSASTIGLSAALGTLGGIAFAQASSAVMRFAQQGIMAAASYEQTVISMQGIFQGSGLSMQQAAQKTEKFLGELRDFAARTPFELPQTLDAVKRLLSIGYTAEDVKDRMLPAIGDITAALGQPASAINGVVYAFGQMKSAGRVLSQDLMQIGNALPGFNAKMTIAKELFNGDVGAMTKAMESGSLDSNKAIDALIQGMQKFPGAANAMERQSKTLNGVISTFKDTVNNALIDGLMPAIPTLSGAMEKLVGPVSDLATAFAQALGPALIKIVESAQNFIPILTDFAVRMLNMVPTVMNIVAVFLRLAPAIAAVVGPLVALSLAFKAYQGLDALLGKVATALSAVTKKQIAFNIATLANPYVAIAAAIVAALAAVALAFKYVYDRSEELRRATAVLIQTIKNIVGVLVGDLLGAWRSITGQTDKAGKASMNIGDVFSKIVDIAGRFLTKVLEGVTVLFQRIGQVIRIVIKYTEIFIKVIQMIAGVVRTVFVMAFNKATEILSGILEKLGPLGTAIKRVGKAFTDAFGNLPNFMRNVMSNATGFIETAVNKAIDAINALISAYNKIPGLADISLIDKFEFADFGDAAAQVAKDAARTAAIAGEAARDANLAARLSASTAVAAAEVPTTTGGADGKGKKAKERLNELKKQFDELKKTLNSAVQAYNTIAEATESKFGEESQIIKAFGSAGDISSAISMFDQLDAALRDYYESLEKAAGKNKQLTTQIRTEAASQREALKSAVQTSVNLFRERQRILDAIEQAEKDYAAAQERINNRYDQLEKAAQANIDAIEARYAALIPQLEKSLQAANAAFEKENGVLENLISERNDFLGNIAQGFRSFLNAFEVDEGGRSFSAALDERLTALREFSANIRSLVERGLDPTLVREFVSAGVSGAGDLVAQLAGASADELAAINAAQAGLATEITAFQEYANQQWFEAGIAQQQAIVAPLQTAATQAQMALDMANQSRATELAAAQAHLAALRDARQAELAQAKVDYDNAVAVLKGQLDTNETNIKDNAAKIQAIMTALGDPADPKSLPNLLLKVGKDAGQGLINGLASKEAGLRATARRLAEAMNAEFRATLQIGSPSKITKTIGQQVADGLILGMEMSMGAVESAAAGLAQAALPSLPAGRYTMDGGTYGGGAGGGGRSVVIQPGAVQITIGGSMDDRSAAEIQAIVDDSLMRLAREIRRT